MKHNLCVIGYGGMGGWHVKNAQTSDVVNLKGVYDIDPAKKEKAKENGVFFYDSLEAVLSDESVDLVTIATPNDTHLELVVKCLEGGKNVICEKPAAMNSDELQKMIDTSKKTGKLFTVHQNRRWDSEFLAMKQICDSGEIGNVFNFESRVQGSRGIPGDWRKTKAQGGGMVLDWGVHLIDQLLQIFPDKIEKVYCHLDYYTKAEVDDGMHLFVYFEGGRRAYIEVSTTNFIALPRFYMLGEEGSAKIDHWLAKARVTSCKQWFEENVTPVITSAGLTKTMAPRDDITTESYDVERPQSDVHDFYRNFCAAIEGKEEQKIKHNEIMRVFKVMEACFKSDETGEPVYFPEKL